LVLAPAISGHSGLTSSEAAALRTKYGPNEVAGSQPRSALRHFAGLFLNPLIVILLVASSISVFLHQIPDAIVIITMVLLGVGVNFFQTYRSQQAAARLRERIAPAACALRDGEWKDIWRTDVVPGDIVRLAAGDLVPADGDLLVARDLHLQEAALTGESLPIEKGVSANSESGGTNRVFLGTSVVSGTATMLVTATGPATVFGDIAKRLVAKPERTEFERELRQFGQLILRSVVFLILFLLVLSAALRREPLESLLFAVALAVGLTPEFLPMITSVTLARGASRMAKDGVLVKRLEAIQNFGSIDILCSDKTGTLTAGSMTLDRAVDASGRAAEFPLLLAYLNSKYETGIRSPFDTAILTLEQPGAEGFAKHDEIPFDFERRLVSVLVERDQGPILIAKGAPESILGRCAHYDATDSAVLLGETVRQECLDLVSRWNQQGSRVLAVAYRYFPGKFAISAADESNLVLAGFLAFSDPPLPDTAEAVEDLRRDGVTLKILTGDSPQVAGFLCERVKLANAEVVLGDDLDRLDDSALAHVAERATVFARVTPAQKNRILLALKHRGHVVGFFGDGINDAPSLHAADVGISAAGATDLARDAADIVVVERGLRVLHAGILEGRRASGNLQKYLLMGTSSNFGNMLSMAAATAFLPFLPMAPSQILLNNFLYDLAQLPIPTDNVDGSYLRTPQRWDLKLTRDFMILAGPISSLYDFLTFFVLLRILHATEKQFHTGWFIESLATQTLVLFVIRTAGNPFRSRPSRALTITVLAVAAFGIVLPFTPLAGPLGFAPLPASYFAFLAVAAATYLGLMQLAKTWLLPSSRRGVESV
jgi:Mg2+-importing ATPase